MTQNHLRRGFAAAGAAISPELERLIEKHRHARAAWDGSSAKYGSALDTTQDEAFTSVVTHQCDTISDARPWAAYIVAHAKTVEAPETYAAALRALAGLPAEEEA